MLERADRTFASFAAGDYVAFTRRFTAADFKAFEKLSGDSNPLHHDAAYASETRFKKPIVPIFLAASPLSAIAGTMLPGHRSLILSSSLRALAPVPYDTDISYSAKIVSTLDAGATLALRAIAFQGDQVLIDADLLVQVRDDVDASRAPAHDSSVTIRRRDGKRALITGANGAIGGAVARALARAGWSLVLQQRGAASEALVRECKEFGAGVESIAADLEKAKDVEALCEKLRGRDDISAFVHTASPPLDAPLSSLVRRQRCRVARHHRSAAAVDADGAGRAYPSCRFVGRSAQYARLGGLYRGKGCGVALDARAQRPLWPLRDRGNGRRAGLCAHKLFGPPSSGRCRRVAAGRSR